MVGAGCLQTCMISLHACLLVGVHALHAVFFLVFLVGLHRPWARPHARDFLPGPFCCCTRRPPATTRSRVSASLRHRLLLPKLLCLPWRPRWAAPSVCRGRRTVSPRPRFLPRRMTWPPVRPCMRRTGAPSRAATTATGSRANTGLRARRSLPGRTMGTLGRRMRELPHARTHVPRPEQMEGPVEPEKACRARQDTQALTGLRCS